jgi:hypothetical protein
LAEEKALLARFAKRAGAGEMLNIHDLKVAYEKAIGHATSDSTAYNLLHRQMNRAGAGPLECMQRNRAERTERLLL